MAITLDQNFSYGYDGQLYNLRTSPESKFECHYQKAKYIPDSINGYKEEAIKICNHISDYAIANKQIPTILLSGGLDSEVVVRAFIDSGREFQCITHRFTNDINKHEIEYIDYFCKSKNITTRYVDLDVVNWLQSDEAMQMADESKCCFATMLPTTKLIKLVHDEGQLPILGNGDFLASKDINPDYRMGLSTQKYRWRYVEAETILAWMRYAIHHNILGFFNFHQQTPEIVLATALNFRFQHACTVHKTGYPTTTRSPKYKMYIDMWPDAKDRPKFTGTEKIEGLCDYIEKTVLHKKYSEYTSTWREDFLAFIERLKPNDS